jgi:hypothetical protein
MAGQGILPAFRGNDAAIHFLDEVICYKKQFCPQERDWRDK